MTPETRAAIERLIFLAAHTYEATPKNVADIATVRAFLESEGNGWRTADKDLPPERVDVLTFCTLRDKYFYEVDFLFSGAWSRRLMAQVTHWHPIPLPPQETRGGE